MISPAIRAVLVGDDREVELAGLHLPHQAGDRLVLRDEAHRPGELVPGCRRALALGADQVLGVGDADDVVAVLAVRPAAGCSRGRSPGRAPAVTVGVVLDDHHVRARHHHLARDGVAELDDALDELALLVLDHVVLGGGLDDAEQLLLADERPLLEALAREAARW